jgi:hypothetical protein
VNKFGQLNILVIDMKMQVTHSSTAKQEEKQEERGSCQTLINIPLRSMLINGGVPLLKDSQPYRSGTSFNIGG